MKFEYDIRQFTWVKAENTFHAEAWNLIAWLQDGQIHPEAFPSDKGEFYIVNTESGNERRFRFVKEDKEAYDFSEEGLGEGLMKYWLFKSEDDIYCKILIETT